MSERLWRAFSKAMQSLLNSEPPSPLVAGLRLKVQIAVEDAVENCGLYRVFCFALVLRGLRHYSTTIARLSFLNGLERGG